MANEVLTVNELGKYLKIGRTTAYQLVKSKDFPSIKIGKKILTPMKKLEDWIEKQTLLNNYTEYG